MTIIQAIILGVIQGITEFLPISSSGHLIVVEELFKLNVTKLVSFDITVHVGTLIAILIYFRQDFLSLFKSLFDWIRRKTPSAETQKHRRLLGHLIIATIPAVIAAVLFKDFLESNVRSSAIVGLFMIIVAVFYVITEHFAKAHPAKVPTWRDALFIGLLQAIALLPGVSRSGSTISAGLWRGLKRQEAARFSFLLGAIAIFGAFVFTLKDIINTPASTISQSVLVVGLISSALSGYASIAFLMKFLGKHSLIIFACYLGLLGSTLVVNSLV